MALTTHCQMDDLVNSRENVGGSIQKDGTDQQVLEEPLKQAYVGLRTYTAPAHFQTMSDTNKSTRLSLGHIITTLSLSLKISGGQMSCGQKNPHSRSRPTLSTELF